MGKKVQGGIAYCPDHHFYALDVCLDGKTYMDFDDARELLLAAGFPLVASPLQRGTLDELLKIDVELLETTVPRQLGYSTSSRFSIAEGIVIRPAKEVGDNMSKDRAMIKKKSKAFWEVTHQLVQVARAAAAVGATSVLTEL